MLAERQCVKSFALSFSHLVAVTLVDVLKTSGGSVQLQPIGGVGKRDL